MLFFPWRGELCCASCWENRRGEGLQPGEPVCPLGKGTLTGLRHTVYADLDKLFAFRLPEAGLRELEQVSEQYLLHTAGRGFQTLEFYRQMELAGCAASLPSERMRDTMEKQKTYQEKYWKALELDKILELLAEKTDCPDAADLARGLRPSADGEEVSRMLRDTDDAYTLMARFGAPSFYGLVEVSGAARRAEAGGMLNLAELLRIAGVLRAMRGIVEWRRKSEGMQTGLDWRLDSLAPNQYLENRIQTAVLSEEEVADHASPQLASIRRKIRSASARVRDQLDKLIHSPAYQKYLQDPIVTMRSGRYVVPVKAECRGDVPGLVHDTSSSGATVFVEPMSVVEANNEIRVLEVQEKEEIERILQELSQEVGGFADALCGGYEAAVELNVIFAKASLAYDMKATLPHLNREGKIVLKSARHPLIDRRKVVPTDIFLGGEFDALVITGPNTGGKTVAHTYIYSLLWPYAA